MPLSSRYCLMRSIVSLARRKQSGSSSDSAKVTITDPWPIVVSVRLRRVQKHLINWLTFKIASAKLLQCFREHSFGFRGDIVVFHVRHACLLSIFREALWRAFTPSYVPFGETIQANSFTMVAFYRSHVRALLNWITARPQH